MSRVMENKARERRIELEAVVDAYNESERAMGWYYYLEERLKFPFKARCKSQRAVSPLRIGEEVNVLAMAPEDECESETQIRDIVGGVGVVMETGLVQYAGRFACDGLVSRSFGLEKTIETASIARTKRSGRRAGSI